MSRKLWYRGEPTRPSSAKEIAWSKARRDANSLADSCINENLRGTHGPATHGVRCEACAAVHKRTA